MSLIKKKDVKNHLAARRRNRIQLALQNTTASAGITEGSPVSTQTPSLDLIDRLNDGHSVPSPAASDSRSGEETIHPE